MKTENHPINDVLAKNATSFFIPPFQRAYAWGRTEIERYYSDIQRIIESELDKNQHDKLEHFFGTVVIKDEKDGFGHKSIVVDGQQRITTTLLFLIALRDIEVGPIKKDFITQTYLVNNTSTYQDKIKLKQVTKDWDAYRALVNKQVPIPGIIANAYKLFFKMLSDKRRAKPDITVEHYISAISKMNVAVIFLDERPFKGEDPQIIFETLNSLGKPLSLSDLVRNFVLLNMDSANQSNIYENTWHPKIESVLNDNTSSFFRDYLQYKTMSPIKAVSDNNTKEIYQLFKSFVEEKFDTHQAFINDIVSYVNIYKWIITEVNTDHISSNDSNNTIIKELLRNIFHDIKTEAFKPFIMGLLSYHQKKSSDFDLNDETLISILKIIRTYLIRRRILSLTQGENKSIVILCSKVEDLAKGKVNIADLLTNMSYKLRLPNNDEMRIILENLNFYEQLRKYSKFILGKIEEHNSKVSVDFRNQKITIEHIMPQTIKDHWIQDLGLNYKETHNKYLHNIGNLILTEFNSEIGCKSFNEKKTKLNTSCLSYRLDITNRDEWNELSIIDHRDKMIDWFLETFSIPEKYRETNNWNSKEVEQSIFSPLEDDAGDFAEGNKPSELIIYDEVLKVVTWQDVLLKFLLYIKNNRKNEFDFIIDNQAELLNKDNAIIKWPILEPLIDKNMDIKNRYKTLDGKTWENVKNLSDTELFIHINISATTCMARIANIMNKLSIPADVVRIKLK